MNTPMNIKVMEFRRHGERGSGKGLTERGFRTAEQRGRALRPPYHLVLSSPKRRCVETARAFGFVHYLLDDRFGPADLSPVEPFERRIRRLRKRERGMKWIEAALRHPEARVALQRIAQGVLRDLASVLHFLPDGGRALIVSHGDIMEAVALLGFEKYEWERLGKPFGHCEGFELEFTSGRLSGIHLHRFEELAARSSTRVKRADKTPAAPKPAG